MQKFIPFEKLPKKKQREISRAKRGSWYGLNPVTRKPESPKAYDRRKAQKWSDDSGSVPFAISRANIRAPRLHTQALGCTAPLGVQAMEDEIYATLPIENINPCLLF